MAHRRITSLALAFAFVGGGITLPAAAQEQGASVLVEGREACYRTIMKDGTSMSDAIDACDELIDETKNKLLEEERKKTPGISSGALAAILYYFYFTPGQKLPQVYVPHADGGVKYVHGAERNVQPAPHFTPEQKQKLQPVVKKPVVASPKKGALPPRIPPRTIRR